MPPSVRDYFHSRGILSKIHPNFEFREGQLEMAQAVAEALEEHRHLIVEAGTGTGKTMAYLIPAILSNKRVVVSTGTKNLQEQLYFKDIPLLEKIFQRPLKVTYMKGRANYLCRQKVTEATVSESAWLEGMHEVSDFRTIRDWMPHTEMGDRSELRTLPEHSSVWAKVDARSDKCTGQKCVHFDDCFITAMMRRAVDSDIIIVNHHLFFADLAVKQEDFGGIIPKYDSVIFDEAHEIEDVVGQYFGMTVSNLQVQDLVRDITDLARRKEFLTTSFEGLLRKAVESTERFFLLFGQVEGRSSFREHKAFLEQFREEYAGAIMGLGVLATQLQLVEGAVDEVIPLHRRAKAIEEALQFFLEGEDTRFVFWTEKRGRGIHLQATPIDVSAILEEKLFEQIPSAILTSATLAVGGDFEFLKNRLGIPHSRTLVVDSPFDFQKQALLYIPQHLPDPRSASYGTLAAKEIVKLLNLSEGRAFCLFTSYSQMKATHERVAMEIPYPILLQGSKPRHVLLDEFRKTPNAVLFATSSFWQGVDVQGDQLSCVIIDKLPFAVPTDPVVEARSNQIKQAGGQPFYEYQIPQAAIALKQGFGRLIRAKSDRGVLALLDTRITATKYGQVFFDSLPDYGFTTDISEIERFFQCTK
ncbi:ATP-dependent DNA helicase [Bryobacter aggregatus]|uniref:ATP-dependent DNA helicase n=1 Tax=Bryobacter aggregatus TaxID=360054 RepID=UPI000566B608|nr:ATP-dependent DNA helicase [Bryobacter aggregatus]